MPMRNALIVMLRVILIGLGVGAVVALFQRSENFALLFGLFFLVGFLTVLFGQKSRVDHRTHKHHPEHEIDH